MVSIAELTSWKPGALTTAADQLSRDRTALLDLQDEIDGGKPPSDWRSDDATKARGRFTQLRDDLNDLAAPLSEVIYALDAAASEVQAAKSSLAGAQAQARQQGWHVSESGGQVVVTDPGATDGPADVFLNVLLTECAHQMADALTRAERADTDLQSVLTSAGNGVFDGGTGSIAHATALPFSPGTDAARHAAQMAAFTSFYGRPPTTPTDWSMAAMLDTHSYQGKNAGTDAVLQVGRVTPQPGKGLVRLALYIPSAEVFNFPHYDVGDDRGTDEHFDPEQARVSLYIDYETGTVVARQNPSVDTTGEVRVDTPDVLVSETTTGAVRVEYDAANPFAPPDPTNSHTVKGDVVVTPPSGNGTDWKLDGSIGDYPAFEVYHDDPAGSTTVLDQDSADNEGPAGPLLELPHHHDVGAGPDSDAVKQFGDLGRPISGPYYEYTPRHGAPLGGVDDPTQVDPRPPFGQEPAPGTGVA